MQLSAFPADYLSAHLLVCLFVNIIYLSFCLSVYLYIYTYRSTYKYIYIYIFLCFFIIRLLFVRVWSMHVPEVGGRVLP